MKLLRKSIEKDGSGTIKLCAEEPDDMWHAYNIITPGDFLEATTVRRVQREGAGGTTDSQRVRVSLEIVVVSVDFDATAGVLHLNGRNRLENKYVKKGAYHTIDLAHGTPFSVTKTNWDSVYLSRIDVACDPVNYADVAVIVMQEGLAHLCLLTPSMTITKAKIEVSIPRKRRGHNSGRDKAISQFHGAIVEAILLHIRFDVVKAVLIASPAFYKDEFATFLWLEAQRRELRDLIANRSKFILCHASSGHRHAVAEVLSDPANLERLGDTKASLETRRLQEFYAMLSSDPDRALYGYSHVKLASERCAIRTLMVTDGLFRSADLAERKRYVALVEGVEANAGEVLVFSSAHVSGEELGQFSGVAAILRFPLPDVAEMTMEDINAGAGSYHDADDDDDDATHE